MTPYVVNEDESGGSETVAQKPKSISVAPPGTTTNGLQNGAATTNGLQNGAVTTNGVLRHANGRVVVRGEEDAVDTPDSLPSRSSVSGRSIIGNGRNGKSGALKRVSFGSSKGSMVETLVYDHQEDLADLPPFLLPVTNGEDSRVVPAKVRVKFFESQQPVAQIACAPPSPDVTLDFGSDAMTSPISEQSPDYHRQISHESGIDNPFRPDGELSREAETIVNLIKEGKPITPVKGEELEPDGVVGNGIHYDQSDSVLTGPAAQNGKEVQEVVITPNSTSPVSATKSKSGANGSTPKDQKPGVVEVQHAIIVPPTDSSAVEQVVIKKKQKCNCCIIQ